MLLFVYITQIPDLLLSELPLQETVSNTVFLVPETGRVFHMPVLSGKHKIKQKRKRKRPRQGFE